MNEENAVLDAEEEVDEGLALVEWALFALLFTIVVGITIRVVTGPDEEVVVLTECIGEVAYAEVWDEPLGTHLVRAPEFDARCP